MLSHASRPLDGSADSCTLCILSYTGFAAPPAHQRELSSPVSLRSLLHACAGAQGASGPKGTQGGDLGAQGALRAPWAIGG